ncbi:winged helix-turn-helix domain-containing protein [Yersinia pekkanenii]|uniref:Regulatory protein n=1 Tax=Yersinia pekkanenii TaxID=1288385 RepID=A0A0T9P437_9GAMM|nr:transcriptional regulator [Yersinia pekkanenii]CNH44707.1 putative regulatory protein [Yersinia pekkanenii]CRY67661.1 putative regulatory protein [Yersinia pekkanenii]
MKNRTYTVNNWSIDLTSGFITHRDMQETKRLGEYQLKLITVLLEHVGEILSRDELTNLVWKRRVIGNNSLPNAIHTLRVALGDENKQQSIIQTIPKMGYLLDPAFCEITEYDIEEGIKESIEQSQPHADAMMAQETPSPPAFNATSRENTPTAETSPPPAAQTHHHSPTLMPRVTDPAKPRRILGRRHLFVALLLVAVIIAGLSHLLRHSPQGPQYHAIEQDQGTFSNINLFQLVDAQLSQQQDETLNPRIKDTLYTLNKQIKSNDTHINIYYYVSLRRLDFTFMVENQCTKKQLSMTIYHWRQNDQLLNNLIYREMERKINEMDNC